MAEPSAAYPFESRYAEVLGSRMHYIEQGAGRPVLFLHGNPTWSYLWRNIIPLVSPGARCIAVDLIGMGKSDKPDLDYSFADHARHLDGFIEKMGLKDLTLVIHDWGSALGFYYARRHEANVRGIAFMEAIIKPYDSWAEWPEAARQVFQGFRTPELGWNLAAEKNVFIERVLPGSILRKLSEEEMNQYRMPFPDAASRKPVWRWPNQIPIAGEPPEMTAIARDYAEWLQKSPIPKLFLTFKPGAINTPEITEWTKKHLRNLTTVDCGAGSHFVQEDEPEAIGRAIAEWLAKIP